MSIYMAAYFPVFVAAARIAVHRYSVPLVLAVPLTWVGLEYLRAHLMTGFAWYVLGHAQYRLIELIQVSDLVGAYGVSFVIAMMSAALPICSDPILSSPIALAPSQVSIFTTPTAFRAPGPERRTWIFAAVSAS